VDDTYLKLDGKHIGQRSRSAPRAATSAQAAGAATAKAAKRLDRMGLSRRDTAEVLGISHQRVQQLLVP
jgi:transposase-like protein